MAEKTMPSVGKKNQVVKHEVTRNPEKFVTPLVDIFEDKTGLTLLADLPGIEKDGLHVHVENGILTIEGRAKEMAKRDYIMQEFEPVNFFRQFELSDTVDQEKIGAELKNGVLELTLPKAESAKPKQIEVTIA